MGRVVSPLDVRIRAALVNPSFPVHSSSITARVHRDLGVKSSCTITTSPTRIVSWLVPLLRRYSRKDVRHSCAKRRQKWSISCACRWARRVTSSLLPWEQLASGLSQNGRLVSMRPCSRCDVVNGTSGGSSLICVTGSGGGSGARWRIPVTSLIVSFPGTFSMRSPVVTPYVCNTPGSLLSSLSGGGSVHSPIYMYDKFVE